MSKPYIIYCKPLGWGFFANFFLIFDGIALTDRNGWTPVVDLERYRTHYNEPEPVNGTRNAWEYYFDQPGGMTLHEALAAQAETNEGKPTREFFRMPTNIDDERLGGGVAAYGRSLRARYIHVRPDVKASVDALLPPGRGTDMLGVHVRGTDMRQGMTAGHPISASAQVYLERAVALVKEKQLSRVYLACDEVETVALFEEEFGSTLVVADAFRMSAQVALGRDLPWFDASDRHLHRYLLGREVLVDVLSLARCATLLCGPSNVAIAAVFFAEAQIDVRGVAPVALAPRRMQRRYVSPKRVWRFGSAQIRRRLGQGGPATG